MKVPIMKHDRPMWPPGAEIAAQAFQAFEIWRQKIDPEGEQDILDLIDTYNKYNAGMYNKHNAGIAKSWLGYGERDDNAESGAEQSKTLNEAPITQDEMFAMFDEKIPIEAFNLIWNSPRDMTIGQIRARLREIAMETNEPTLLERLRSEAVNWSSSCGDLFNEAADEIERLQRTLDVIKSKK